MKILYLSFIILFMFFSARSQDTISVCAWNIENLGKSKSDEVIDYIASTVKGFDVVAIMEVVSGDGGVQAVAKLSDVLNRMGAKWDYVVSDPTVSSSYKTERYAFIWKTNILKKIGDAWLEQKLNQEIDREPFYANFKAKDKVFTLVNFHAITKSKQPETEIKYFKFLPAEYPDKNLIFVGDYNCPQSHTVFNPLKSMGYRPIFTSQKTTLKQQCIYDECLASEFDNIFYNTELVNFLNSGVIHFYKDFIDLREARKVSDHLPVYFKFSLN